MNEIINFGKYRGKGLTFAQVLETDSSYLRWIMENTRLYIPTEVRKALLENKQLSLDPNVPLTDEQRAIAEAVLAGKNVVVVGPAGTGKTQVVKALKGSCSVRIAPTGIAAVNISGVTFHSIFKIDPNDPLIEVKKQLDGSITVLIFDECFYSSASLLFRAIESLQTSNRLQNCRFLFMGDPMQLKPVHVRRDEKDLLELEEDEKEIVGELDAWKGAKLYDVLDHFGIEYQQFYLTRSIRHENQETFGIMMGARSGSLNEKQLRLLNERVTNKIPDDAFSLVPTNAIRKKLNVDYLTKFSDIREFAPIQHVQINMPGTNNAEKLQAYVNENPKMDFLFGKLKRSGYKFKPAQYAINCKIMITKNDNKLRIVNGDMGHITEIEDHAITCYIERIQKEVVIERIFSGFQTRDKTVAIGLMDFPIRVAAAATIHKTQGITVYGPLHIFITPEMKKQPGLLYTAITRVRTLDQLTFSDNVSNRHFCFDKEWKRLLEEGVNA